jgi:hypothetical protein
MMQATLIIALVLHVLSGVFWAGSTFALARTGGNQAERFFRPQMGAATIAIVTGGLLGYLLHRGTPGIQEHLLAIGALCALLAAGVQGSGARAVKALSAAGAGEALAASSRVATSQRIAAALLAVTVICMAAARYA